MKVEHSETLQQMMDPKMDGGMNGVSISYSLDEKIEMGLLPDDSKFSIPELLSIMDFLVACEVSSRCGATLTSLSRSHGSMVNHQFKPSLVVFILKESL